MKMARKKRMGLNAWLFLLYLAFLASMVFSLRAVSSTSIALIFITSIALNKYEQRGFFNPRLRNFFLIACAIFFFVQAFGIIYTHNPHEQWRDIRGKTILLIVPLALCSSSFINAEIKRKLMVGFCFILSFAAILCLSFATWHFFVNGDLSSFFYFKLLSPFHHHAIQFSIFVLITLIFLFESSVKKDWAGNRRLHYFFSALLVIFLCLLSSKLMLALFIAYLIFFYITTARIDAAKNWRRPALAMIVLTVIITVLYLPNPVSARFKEISQGGLQMVRQDRFQQGDYFNGLQFRMLQWRFVPAILTRANAWSMGVSAGDAQKYLDQSYIDHNMYTGTVERNDHGFLGYNAHNEFLESLLQSGIAGLAAFLVVCIAMIKLALQKRRRGLAWVVIILLAYSFSESVMESQYNLFLFTFFPLFFYLD